MPTLTDKINAKTPARLSKTPEFYLLLTLIDSHQITTKKQLTQHLSDRIQTATNQLKLYDSPSTNRLKQKTEHQLRVLNTLQKFASYL